MSNKSNATVATMGIDIGKNSFHVVGLDQRGAIVLRQKWSRGQIEARLAAMPPCLIGMEACVGAHHLSRKLQSYGHDARLMPAKYVRAYSKGQKNDFRDAEAIAEAVQRPTMKFVATKTADQLDLQALHRVRERLVRQRTGIINQIRAFLLERGVAVRQGLRFLRTELPGILAKRSDVLSPRMMRIIENLAVDWRRLDERIASREALLPAPGPDVAHAGASIYDLLRFQVGRGDFGRVDDVDLVVQQCAALALVPGGNRYESKRRTAGGRYLEFNFKPLDDGSLLAVHRDITCTSASSAASIASCCTATPAGRSARARH